MTAPTYRLKPGVTPDDVRNVIRKQLEKNSPVLVAFYELLWGASRNPWFAWAALSYLTLPSAPQTVLPPWLRDYLRQASANIVQVTNNRPAEEVPALVPQALELSRQGANAAADAHKLLNALQLYGDYVVCKESAPDEARAQWAIGQIYKEYRLQSPEAAQRQIREGKRLVEKIQKASGRPFDRRAVEEAAKKFRIIRTIQEKLDAVAPLPVETYADLRAAFSGSPRARKRRDKIC
jgi:hypothetical protein